MDLSANPTYEGNDTPINANTVTPNSRSETVVVPLESEGNNNENSTAPPEPTANTSDVDIPDDILVTDFTEDLATYKHQEELALTAMVSLGTRTTATEMPTIKPGKWKFAGKTPNPISIRRARRMLAAAYAKIPCTQQGAGVHGYAWIAEAPEDWKKRKGTGPIDLPDKPEEDYTDFQGQLTHAREMEKYLMYHHLIQAGAEKLVAWFGKAMFLDLCTDGELDADVTPKELLEHLEETYATNADELDYFEDVTKAFNAPYNASRPVEEYFMGLQEAQTDSKDLGIAFTDTQVITQALCQFVKQHGKDGRKYANKWNEEGDKSWRAFKIFWKRKIHEMGRVKEANVVEQLSDEMGSLRSDMLALQVENRTVKERNDELEYAFQTEMARHRTGNGTADDTSTVSTITEAMSQMEQRFNRKMANFNATLSNSSNTTITHDTTTSDTRMNNLKLAKNRRPDAYKHINGGRGKQFMFYCTNCGVNCTHNTDRCYELTKEQKEKCKFATVHDRMGGSDRHLERFGRFQCDYNFDSL